LQPAARGVIELPQNVIISTSSKPTGVVRKLYAVLNMKDLERRRNVSLTYLNKVRLFKHNFAQPTQFCVSKRINDLQISKNEETPAQS